MRIEKCGIARNIDDSKWPEYAGRGYIMADAKDTKKAGKAVKEPKNGAENSSSKDKTKEQAKNDDGGGADDESRGAGEA